MTVKSARVAILVKALPQPSKRYGETVCCAGVTSSHEWKRLYPIRFRHLSGDQSFKRWDWVNFNYVPPVRDGRPESCHVYEDTIRIGGSLRTKERAALLTRMIKPSVSAAAEAGHSLAAIRPKDTRFRWRKKTAKQINSERDAYRRSAAQTSLFDKELSELEPCPFEFVFRFADEAGTHEYRNGDWEAHAMFWRESKRTSEGEALKWMDHVFNEQYPRRGMVFAVGNQAKRPHVWQLLGVIRLDEVEQGELF